MNIQSEARKRYTQKRTSKAIDYLGGECDDCGAKSNLHFHHVDPESKSIEISNAIRVQCWSWKRLVLELDKCKLLCKRCHRKHHNSDAEHGDARRYWRGCRCRACTTANSQHNLEYKKRVKHSVQSVC